jgi:hypothetical protein
VDVTGVVSIRSGESQILSTLIEKKGAADPVKEATQFLASCNIGDQDCATLTGSYGKDGTTPVFFVTAAVKAPMSACQSAESFVAAARRPSRKSKPAAPRAKRPKPKPLVKAKKTRTLSRSKAASTRSKPKRRK